MYMYCINCGREWNEGELYCGSCGALRSSQVPVQNNNVVQNVPQTKKSFPTWAIILIIVGAILLAGVIGLFCLIFFVFVIVDSFEYIPEQTDSYVYIGGEEIPTLYEYDIEYMMCDYPSYTYDDNEESIEYSYCDSYLYEDDYNNYLDYLVEEYGFTEDVSDDEERIISKYTDDELYYVSVKVDFDDDIIAYISTEIEEIEEDNSV